VVRLTASRKFCNRKRTLIEITMCLGDGDVESTTKKGCCSSSSLFRGISEDFQRRMPHYISDWTDGWNLKVLAAILFIFFTSIGPAITFAELLQAETGQIGVVEVLLSSALSGGIFSIFAGQPLVILGVTGPVSILTISIYGMAKTLGVNFLPFYAWSQIWAALMHMVLAAINACDFIAYVTRFSCETFGVLIALIYLYTGIYGVVEYFNEEDFSHALLQLLLAFGTVYLANILSAARDWKVTNAAIREVIADYGPTVSLIAWAGISWAGRAGNTNIPRLSVPDSFETTANRSWFVDLSDIESWAIIAAIIPGIIITVLFVFDHNVSSLMAQGEELNLKKGSAFHLDFFVLGFCILVTGLLGIPPCNGLIPQAPLHTKALSQTSEVEINGVRTRKIDHVYEQRYSNLIQACLTLIMCFPPMLHIIGMIPQSSLDGLFIFMGLASFDGNQFYERIMLYVTEPRLRSSQYNFFVELPFHTINRFTFIQAICCLVIFGLTLTPAAMIFPLLIAALVAIRIYGLSKYFSKKDLDLLDFLDIEGTKLKMQNSGSQIELLTSSELGLDLDTLETPAI
jgi:boron transporter